MFVVRFRATSIKLGNYEMIEDFVLSTVTLDGWALHSLSLMLLEPSQNFICHIISASFDAAWISATFYHALFRCKYTQNVKSQRRIVLVVFLNLWHFHFERIPLQTYQRALQAPIYTIKLQLGVYITYNTRYSELFNSFGTNRDNMWNSKLRIFRRPKSFL